MRRTFVDYLNESAAEKKYEFKIKIAGELPDNCEDCIESALQQFSVSRFTKGKRTPIQANLLEFPNIKNAEMTIFEAEVDYPTTSTVVAELVANSTGISRDCIKVRTPVEEANWEIENENQEPEHKPALLTTDYEKSKYPSCEKTLSGFLKELAKERKDTGLKQVKGVNDQLLAKKPHSEKSQAMPQVGPARSLFGKPNIK